MDSQLAVHINIASIFDITTEADPELFICVCVGGWGGGGGGWMVGAIICGRMPPSWGVINIGCLLLLLLFFNIIIFYLF